MTLFSVQDSMATTMQHVATPEAFVSMALAFANVYCIVTPLLPSFVPATMLNLSHLSHFCSN
jgi:hypothetical protein